MSCQPARDSLNQQNLFLDQKVSGKKFFAKVGLKVVLVENNYVPMIPDVSATTAIASLLCYLYS